MNEDIIVVGIVFGSIFGIVLISLLFSLIKTSIKSKKGNYDDEAFHRMAQAFIQHKKNTEKRLKNLEAIVTGDEDEIQQKELEDAEQTIEIENKKSTEKNMESNNQLKNILKE